ncbi:MAG: right-handed parallel beta-helix repeat-containing protein [Planctomycetota bacterium]
MMTRTFLLCSFVAFAPQLAGAADLAVPATFPTIQGAIVAAQSGDRVLVAPGTYLEHIDFLGKAIEVVGVQGPTVTIIDGSSSDTVVRFVNDEGSASLLEGFTIRNGQPMLFGFGDDGGGIRCVDSDPTIRNNVIEDNVAFWTGAGIACWNSNAMIEGNEIRSNHFTCLIADAPCGDGAGIFISGGSPTIQGNLIHDNIAPRSGGAIHIQDASSVTMEGNRLLSNDGGNGGALTIRDTTASVANHLVAVNSANGFFSLTGHIPGTGGGIRVMGNSVVTFELCTVADNQALPGGSGGGLHVEPTATVAIHNSIVWGNMASAVPQLSGVTVVSYSDVEGGVAGLGNIDVAPAFVGVANGGYFLAHLATGQAVDSPCVDAGDPMTVPSGSTRSDGVDDGGTVDLGYHRGAATLNQFVRGDCSGDGTVNIADAIFELGQLFPIGTPPPLGCADACDGNDDGNMDLSDVVVLLNSLFGASPTPLPAPLVCGSDPTADGLSCAAFPACP